MSGGKVASGGATATAGGTTGAGGTTASNGGSSTTTGGTTGSGGTIASNGGSSVGSGGATSSTGGSTATGATQTTVDLLTAPDPCASGQPSTHNDGWLCVLHAPAAGDNEMGAWYDYTWPTCPAPTFSHASQKICFSGGPCTGAGGAGLGLSLCDIEASIATWPAWQAVAKAGNIPVGTGAQGTFGQCNSGAAITSVSWTLTGNTPAGMALQFQGAGAAANTGGTTLGSVTVAAGTTSVTVPATVDGSKIASLQWSFPASSVTTNWNFCLTGLKLQYH